MEYKIKLTGTNNKTRSSHAIFKTREEAKKVIKMSKKIPSFKKGVKKYTIIKVGGKK